MCLTLDFRRLFLYIKYRLLIFKTMNLKKIFDSQKVKDSLDNEVYVVTFDTEDIASDEEYYFRDSWGQYADTALEGNTLYVLPNHIEAVQALKSWYGDKAIVAENSEELKEKFFPFY